MLSVWIMAPGGTIETEPVDDLRGELEGLVELHALGDCLAPRTAEEAVYEGLKVGCAL